MLLIDTNIAIELRNGDDTISDRLQKLDVSFLMSVVTLVELEGGVHTVVGEAAVRRQRLDTMLEAIPVLVFDTHCAEAYGNIVAQSGFSRRKITDRMIAATALVHRATLATLNPNDFLDVPGLHLEDWTR